LTAVRNPIYFGKMTRKANTTWRSISANLERGRPDRENSRSSFYQRNRKVGVPIEATSGNRHSSSNQVFTDQDDSIDQVTLLVLIWCLKYQFTITNLVRHRGLDFERTAMKKYKHYLGRSFDRPWAIRPRFRLLKVPVFRYARRTPLACADNYN